MKVIKYKEELDNTNKDIVAVLGKFESMHLGHKKLIRVASEFAYDNNSNLMLMMFSQREEGNFYSFKERVMFAKEFEIDYILEFEPNEENLSNTWEDFNLYLKNIGVTKVVCGPDFKYGKDREGNLETLKVDFEVKEIAEVLLDGLPIRTTTLFNAIKNDDLDLYKKMTGHYFFYDGVVVRGFGNGKKFGMPTANVSYPKHKININEGIYYSFVIYDGKRMPSLTSISKNPTLNAKEVTYETYIYNFDEDIYDEVIYVELIEKYRDPIKFNSIEELVDKLAEDKELGKDFFGLE